MKLIVKNKAEIAEDVSDRIINLVKEKPNCILGLATGSTPIETYDLVIKKAKEQHVDFSKVVTFNLDEYLNNNDVEQSYKYFMHIHLFDALGIKEEQTHFPSEENYKNYDEMIKKAGGIDLQLLGIGRDGHIGFNEPGTSFESHTQIVDLTKETIQDNSRFFKSIDDVPTQAISMGLDTIMHAKEIILIATGKNKKEALKNMFKKPDEACPASVLNGHTNTFVYCDLEAAI